MMKDGGNIGLQTGASQGAFSYMAPSSAQPPFTPDGRRVEGNNVVLQPEIATGQLVVLSEVPQTTTEPAPVIQKSISFYFVTPSCLERIHVIFKGFIISLGHFIQHSAIYPPIKFVADIAVSVACFVANVACFLFDILNRFATNLWLFTKVKICCCLVEKKPSAAGHLIPEMLLSNLDKRKETFNNIEFEKAAISKTLLYFRELLDIATRLLEELPTSRNDLILEGLSKDEELKKQIHGCWPEKVLFAPGLEQVLEKSQPEGVLLNFSNAAVEVVFKQIPKTYYSKFYKAFVKSSSVESTRHSDFLLRNELQKIVDKEVTPFEKEPRLAKTVKAFTIRVVLNVAIALSEQAPSKRKKIILSLLENALEQEKGIDSKYKEELKQQICNYWPEKSIEGVDLELIVKQSTSERILIEFVEAILRIVSNKTTNDYTGIYKTLLKNELENIFNQILRAKTPPVNPDNKVLAANLSNHVHNVLIDQQRKIDSQAFLEAKKEAHLLLEVLCNDLSLFEANASNPVQIKKREWFFKYLIDATPDRKKQIIQTILSHFSKYHVQAISRCLRALVSNAVIKSLPAQDAAQREALKNISDNFAEAFNKGPEELASANFEPMFKVLKAFLDFRKAEKTFMQKMPGWTRAEFSPLSKN